MKSRIFSIYPQGLIGLTLSLCTLLPGLVIADETDFHKVYFNVSESLDVRHDLINVQFMAHHQADKPQIVTQVINQTMRDALNQLSAKERQFAQTGQYYIQPVRNKEGEITHWSGQQMLQLNLPLTLDVAAVLAKLQTHLIYQTMQGELSQSAQQQAQTTLTEQALKRYQAQAQQLATGLNANDYRLIETRLQFIGAPYRPQARMMMAMDSVSANSAPAIEAGEQRLTLSIDGVLVIPH